MASVQELIAASEQNKSPFIKLLEGAAQGFGGAQNQALERTKTLMLMDQQRQDMARKAQMQEMFRQHMAGQQEAKTGQEFKSMAGKPQPVMPIQKLEWEVDHEGNPSYKIKTEENKVPKIAALESQFGYKPGELGDDYDAAKMKVQSDNSDKRMATMVSPSLVYQMEKDKKKAEIDLQELQVQGYKLGPNIRPTSKEAEDMKNTVGRMEDFTKGIDQMIGLVKKYGSTNITGEGAGEMESLASTLKLSLKDIAKLGQISGGDISIMDAQVFDPTQIKSIKTGSKNAVRQLETARARAISSVKAALKNRGYIPDGSATAENKTDQDGGIALSGNKAARLAELRKKQQEGSLQ